MAEDLVEEEMVGWVEDKVAEVEDSVYSQAQVMM